MDCVNHTGVSATAFCQTCGKALCAGCVRTAPGGQVLCEPCFATWQTFQQPFVSVNTGSPNPAAAAVLGLIPGVGAMYNGQFFKGLIHVVIFAVLISMAHISGIFGIFIPAWILYQSFEAFHTAKALRDGQPVPDPLGLNEVGNWLNLGKQPQYPSQPPAGQPPVNPGPFTGPSAGGSGPAQPPPSGSYQPPYSQGPYQTPYQGAWQAPYTPPAPGSPTPGVFDPNAPPPPIPPDPSSYWHPGFWNRGAPVGAVILIALGTLFLLGQLDIFNGRLIEFSWPVFLIGLGIWLVVRRLGESQGGPK
jgi:TM2 domain-containing membrane protein YozV